MNQLKGKIIKSFGLLLLLQFANVTLADSFQSGPYIGLGLGYQYTTGVQAYKFEEAFSSSHPLEDILNEKSGYHMGGIKGSLFFGYLHRFDGTPFAIAVEPFIEYAGGENTIVLEDKRESSFHTSDITKISTKIDQSIGIMLKAGYILREDIMIYGLTGLKWSKVSFARSKILTDIMGGIDNQTWSDSTSMLGRMVGLGVEKAIGKNRLSFELAYTIYPQKTFTNLELPEEGIESTMYGIDTLKIKPKNMSFMIKYSIPL